MIASLRRSFHIYSAIAAMAAKTQLAYNWWFWADILMTIVSMIVFVSFWKAVYTGAPAFGGLTLSQTINYILVVRILAPLLETRMIFFFGSMIRSGQVVVELTRPLDLQTRVMVDSLADAAVYIFQRVPVFIVAWWFFGLQLPGDVAVWVAFCISLLLGMIVMLLFDWCFACLAFYVTEAWGLSVVRIGVGAFFSGSLMPLAIMPGWLQDLAAMMPFAQALAVPVSFLSGISTLAEAPRLWLIQLAWLLGLLVVSRVIFRVAVRKVTVQGG